MDKLEKFTLNWWQIHTFNREMNKAKDKSKATKTKFHDHHNAIVSQNLRHRK